MIQLTVNGEALTLDEPATLARLVTEVAGSDDRAGIAVAVNRDVVPRDRWETTDLDDGDEVEVIAPFAGG